MSFPSFPDLRARMFLALMLPLLLILLGSAYVDYRVARETADLAHDQALADSAYDLEGYLEAWPTLETGEWRKAIAAIARSTQPDQFYFAVRDARGQLLAGASDLPAAQVPGPGGALWFYDANYQGQRLRMVQLLSASQGQALSITVGETRQRRKQSQKRILAAMFWPNLGVIFLCLLAVLFGVRQGLAPLRVIADQVDARSADDLRQIDLGETPSEVRALVERLNTLFGKLQHAAAIQQRFIADAAHQLRTPLAALQSQLDLAVANHDFGEQGERLARIEQASSRIGHLLTQLLAYAQAEASRDLGASPLTTVDLPALLETAASHFLDAALAKEIDLGFEIAPASPLGQAWMLQEALGNLIDNAIRYSPRASVITVRCGEQGGAAFFEVEDSGPGIAPEFQQAVCERFYRLPGNQESGCGLGLAIVQEIAQRHHASLTLASGPTLGGLLVRVQFPTAGAASG